MNCFSLESQLWIISLSYQQQRANDSHWTTPGNTRIRDHPKSFFTTDLPENLHQVYLYTSNSGSCSIHVTKYLTMYKGMISCKVYQRLAWDRLGTLYMTQSCLGHVKITIFCTAQHTKFCGGFLRQPVIVNIGILLCTHLNYRLGSWFLALCNKEKKQESFPSACFVQEISIR